MVLEKAHEEKILEAVRKAAGSVDHGEVQIKIEQTRDILDVVVVTQERVRLEKISEKKRLTENQKSIYLKHK